MSKNTANYNEVDGIVWIKKSMDIQTANTEATDENDSNDTDSEHELGNELPLNDDQMWDDSLLIDMYEKSQKKINEALFKKQLNDQENDQLVNKTNDKKLKNKNQKKNSKCSVNNNTQEWKSGDFCRLVYLEDNVEYEAQILSINSEEKTCHICYIGYENEELRLLSDLKASAGANARKLQAKMAEIGKKEDKKFSSETSSIIPPPAPFFLENGSSYNEDDALASMLMSWYMAGYHTGYYQAQKDFKKSNFKNKS